MDRKTPIVTGGIASTTSCIGGGFVIAFPDMIVPFGWGIALMCLGVAIGIATAIYAFWPTPKETAIDAPPQTVSFDGCISEDNGGDGYVAPDGTTFRDSTAKRNKGKGFHISKRKPS